MGKKKEHFEMLPLGSITPTGWLALQMRKDIDGFIGNLDKIVPDLIHDPIYASEGRLHAKSEPRDLGNLKIGDAEGDDQYKWWNSETQSNWWDGYIRHVFLMNDEKGIEKVHQYVESILSTQDDDGYLGIYAKELRYKFTSENGELWSKATLYRGLLAYYEFSKSPKVLTAVRKAVENVMMNYPANASSPFSSGNSFNGGVSHGLVFTDVLERLYFFTKDEMYREYALFLYHDFSSTYQSECDAQLPNILDTDYQLQSHGVHTFEHLRAVIIASYASENKELETALETYVKRIQSVTTMSGGAIGDEWIACRLADSTHTGYEYCSLQELLDSYCLLFQKTGKASIGDTIETIFFNAAQGARHPKHSCIAYLKTDNSYEMLGSKNGKEEYGRIQTRYKYSPAHQDIAVCCSPNAGRISPYFLHNSWLKENSHTFVATLLVPNRVEFFIDNAKIVIENTSAYPFENYVNFKIQTETPRAFTLKIRKPNWAKSIKTSEVCTLKNDFIEIQRTFLPNDEIHIHFETEIVVKKDANGGHSFFYGALLYAKPIESIEFEGKRYTEHFSDFMYAPIQLYTYSYIPEYMTENQHEYAHGVIRTQLKNVQTNEIEQVELIPLAKTILRQATFH
jgi:DUF1680 family protein